MSLEHRQRDFLGLMDEPMPFNEASLAECLDTICENAEPDDAFFLRGIIHALRHPESEWKLRLVRRKRGKFIPPDVSAEKHHREMTMLHALALFEHEGMKTEAAIATIAEKMGVSRATVFAGVRRCEKFLASGADIFASMGKSENFKNPRPAKKRDA